MREKTSDVFRSRDSDALHAAFEREGCPVCTIMLEYLELAIDSWEYEGFTDGEHRRRSSGLCLTHFTQARQFAGEHAPVIVSHLLACQRTCTRHVLEEVRELVRKHDYRFSDEPRGNEMTSW